MAGPFYVRSTNGSDADTGVSWDLAEATLAAGATDAAAGERVWVSQSHAESPGGSTAITITSAGTLASPCHILCGNDGAEPPTALATTATVTTSGTGALSIKGSIYVYGITFNCGTGASSAVLNLANSGNHEVQKYESCAFNVVNTGTASAAILIGSTSTRVVHVELRNCSVSFGATAQSFKMYGATLDWIGGSLAAGAAIPTALFTFTEDGSNLRPVCVNVVGVDLSLAGSGKSLVNAALVSNGVISFIDCKLGASVALTSGTWAGLGGRVRLHNSDSADTNYRMEEQCYQGSIVNSSTITRTGGANDGTNGIGWVMTSAANAEYPAIVLDSPEIVKWNETATGTLTVTVEIATNNVTLKDDECWLEVTCQGTTSYPLGVVTTDCKSSILATAANQDTSSVTWANVPGTPVKQYLRASITPKSKGFIKAKVMLAKASTTVYVDPLLTIA